MRTRIFLLAGILGLVALAVVWFRNNFEQVLVKEWVGASGEARQRPFLAAERFAERMGWKANELRSLPQLDSLPAGGVLLLPNRRQALTRDRLMELVRWAGRGGHLIAEAEYLGVPDPLLDILGVQRAEQAAAANKPLLVEVPETGRRLSVAMPGGMKLVTAESDVRLRAGEQLVSFGHGRGVVTVATTLNFARNRSIGANDHAELFWHLLALTYGRELVVYWSPSRLSLWDFLKEHAAPALAAGGLLLALWLWSIAPRFGPVAPDAPPGRRRLLDHLRASGRYYWVKGLRSRLVVAARDAALRRIARAQPDFATASQAERISRLSSLAQIPKEDAARFLSAAGAMRGADFIKVTQHAQRVHSALEKGNK
ncbi:MAG TPA: DUF4350 domain-containing protein [Burkholderiales bacterium]|nr:DUF4350 domain-containing protein [Burkholderiales bacterium]